MSMTPAMHSKTEQLKKDLAIPAKGSESTLTDLLYCDLTDLMRQCASHNAAKNMQAIYGLLERVHDKLYLPNVDNVIVPKKTYQNLINIKSLAVEAHKRFVDYEMDVDTEAPYEHRDFMRRLKKHLAI